MDIRRDTRRPPWTGCADPMGRAVVLVHGAGGDHRVWDRVADRLREVGVPTLALDLPGHGRNVDPPTPTVSDRADAVEAMVAKTGARSFVLVGHSLGGAVVLCLACRGMGGLAGIGIVSSGARMPVAQMILKGTLDAFDCTTERLARFLFAPTASAATLRVGTDLLSSAGGATLHADFSACAAFHLAPDALQAVRVPAEIVCGELDVLTPLPLSEELAANLRNSRLTRLAGVGHMPLLEDPAALSNVLGDLWVRAFGRGTGADPGRPG